MTRLPPPYQPEYFEREPHPVIVLEGVSGIGKSTLSSLLATRLGASGLHTLSDPHSGWSSAVNRELRPLPQLAFYASGLLHVSDRIRRARAHGPVVADRYLSSVIACHAAVHRIPVHQVTAFLKPYKPYITSPTRTYYLRCSEDTLRARMAVKTDLKSDDTDLFTISDRLPRLLRNFAEVAEGDETAVWLDTDDKSPSELAGWILTDLEHTVAKTNRLGRRHP
ncbi:thymidylate kinase [Streptomyces sp. NPDC005904]|uniref:thymidylate kinase n=1 Tax=Streptomyces sp. NPDC005904 TaxID=3154570 RepID=UPI0033C7DCD5